MKNNFNQHSIQPNLKHIRLDYGRIDLKKGWHQALKRANIINCRAQDMRHTFCTYAAAKDASNLQLQTVLGHHTLSMLLQYTHMDVEVTKQFRSRISEQILKEQSNHLRQ